LGIFKIHNETSPFWRAQVNRILPTVMLYERSKFSFSYFMYKYFRYTQVMSNVTSL
jgi:hypothetical protein